MNISRLATLRSSKILFVGFIFLGMGNGAKANSDIHLTGSLRAAVWGKDKSFNSDRDYGVGSIWSNLSFSDVAGGKIYFEGFIQGQDLSRRSYSEGDLREAYFEKSLGNLDFKIGRQIIVWGRADKFNPTDNFTTKNMIFLSSDDEDQRMGQGAFQLKYNFEQSRVIAIWQSEWRQPQFPVSPQAGVAIQFKRPDQSQNQFGLKFDSINEAMDWSVSYFDGYSRTPDFQLIDTNPIVKLVLDYGRIQSYGADFAKNLGPYGVRGEVAYTKTQDKDGANPLQQNASIQAVLGADRSWDTLNINMQIIYKNIEQHLDFQSLSNPITKQLAIQSATFSNQKYKEQFGFTLRPSYKMYNETLEIECALVTWQKSGDSVLRPKMTYAINDQIKSILGGEFYYGSEDSLFGQLKNTSSLFAEMRYLF